MVCLCTLCGHFVKDSPPELSRLHPAGAGVEVPEQSLTFTALKPPFGSKNANEPLFDIVKNSFVYK